MSGPSERDRDKAKVMHFIELRCIDKSEFGTAQGHTNLMKNAAGLRKCEQISQPFCKLNITANIPYDLAK